MTKLQTFKLIPQQADYIEIVNLGDIHWGNANCDRKSFIDVINYIKDNPNVYWVSTGDLLEISTKDSKSFDYNASNPQNEFNEMLDILKPISNKCLGFVRSNHHKRIQKSVGIDLDKAIANLLNIPLLGTTGFLRVVVGNCGYFLCLHHGIGGGSKLGSKANNTLQMGINFKGFDVYLSGHNHTNFVHVSLDYVLDRKHYKLIPNPVYYVCAGHFLNYFGSC